ncbi:MAG: FAD-dependent monooxygenase [Hyphomicrobiaceae bacterium]
MARPAPIVIAGGGVCGLSTAIALSINGRHSHILERRADISEAGAGIQLGPNAVRILARLGVDDVLSDRVTVPDAINIFSGKSGERLIQLPLGIWAKKRFGAPYWVALRSDLQSALHRTLRKYTTATFTNGFHVESFEQLTDGVSVFNASKNCVTGSALVAADGMWSQIRDWRFSNTQPKFIGKSAYRTIADRASVPHPFSDGNISLWIGPGMHIESYPVAAGSKICIVGMIDDVQRGTDWGAPTDGRFLLDRVKKWTPQLSDFLSSISSWHRWAIHLGPRLTHWTSGRVALAGDAAQSISPLLPQGGSLAIESAYAIATALEQTPHDPEAAFRRYEMMRRSRSIRVAKLSTLTGQICHLAGWSATIRDSLLRQIPGDRVVKRLDWLYGYDCECDQS